MGHGCHTCGCPNGCECTDEDMFRAKVARLRPRVVVVYAYPQCYATLAQFRSFSSDGFEWIEYVPPFEKRIQGKRLIPICKRCGGSGTVDRGPPAGDGPCPECTRVERAPCCLCPLDARAAGCGCTCHGGYGSHF